VIGREEAEQPQVADWGKGRGDPKEQDECVWT